MQPLDNTGIAYGYLTFAIFIIVATIAYIILVPVLNFYTDNLNDRVSDGAEVSQQTVDSFTLHKTLFQYGTPIFIILCGFFYAILRALEQKRNPS